MKLWKAIEIKEIFYSGGEITSLADYQKADRLSIEALKRLKTLRAFNIGAAIDPLPGETEDKPLYSLGFNTGDDESP